MKYLNIATTLLVFILPLSVNSASTCHGSCFAAKKSCNEKSGHTLNSCDKDLSACKLSCTSGKKQDVYNNPLLPVEVSFSPVLKLDS